MSVPRRRRAALAAVAAALSLAAAAQAAGPVRVASKNFNESYLLAEVLAQRLEAEGIDVERRYGLGGTLICYEALVNDEIDVYVEYSGTVSQAILNRPELETRDALNAVLRERGVVLLEPLGFDNTYALALRRERATALSIRSISDLARHPELRIAVSHEFLERGDGWRGLAERYGLPERVGGIEHALAYQALVDEAIDVTDAYSTDGELERYDLAVLVDDLHYFPEYLAVPLARTDLPEAARRVIDSLAGRIDDATMRRLNGEVVLGGRAFAEVANEFLVDEGLASRVARVDGFRSDLLGNTLTHLKLTAIALALSVLVGVGVSLAVFRIPPLARAVTYACGLLQTIPSIALLALMIPVLGIGPAPAIVALFLYSLLPILRNTLTALTTVDPTLVRVAVAMGLRDAEQLRHVYVPLAMPSTLAGIRTAAVISIGTATLAAFIGAGGLGDPIVTGLALNDAGLILEGAVPAALLAVATELAFEGVERALLPGHLRR